MSDSDAEPSSDSAPQVRVRTRLPTPTPDELKARRGRGRPPLTGLTEEQVSDICVGVYASSFDAGDADSLRKQVGEEKFRAWATFSYASLTRRYAGVLVAMGWKPPE